MEFTEQMLLYPMIEVLCKYGAKVDIKSVGDNFDISPLKIAIKEQREEACITLLHQGASTTIDHEGGSTSDIVFANYSVGNLKEYLGWKLEAAYRSGDRQKIFFAACACGDLNVVEEYFDLAYMQQFNAKGSNPSHVAAEMGQADVLVFFAKSEVDLNVQAQHDSTLLHIACLHAQVDTVATLLELVPEQLEAKDASGQTPLFNIMFNDPVDVEDALRCFQYLKEAGVNVNAVDDQDGVSSLHYAAKRGEVQKIKALLDAGADIDPKNKAGKTPFMFACEFNQLEVVKFLIASHPEVVETISDEGLPGLQYAIKNEFTDIVECIKAFCERQLGVRFFSTNTVGAGAAGAECSAGAAGAAGAECSAGTAGAAGAECSADEITFFNSRFKLEDLTPSPTIQEKNGIRYFHMTDPATATYLQSLQSHGFLWAERSPLPCDTLITIQGVGKCNAIFTVPVKNIASSLKRRRSRGEGRIVVVEFAVDSQKPSFILAACGPVLHPDSPLSDTLFQMGTLQNLFSKAPNANTANSDIHTLSSSSVTLAMAEEF